MEQKQLKTINTCNLATRDTRGFLGIIKPVCFSVSCLIAWWLMNYNRNYYGWSISEFKLTFVIISILPTIPCWKSLINIPGKLISLYQHLLLISPSRKQKRNDLRISVKDGGIALRTQAKIWDRDSCKNSHQP